MYKMIFFLNLILSLAGKHASTERSKKMASHKTLRAST